MKFPIEDIEDRESYKSQKCPFIFLICIVIETILIQYLIILTSRNICQGNEHLPRKRHEVFSAVFLRHRTTTIPLLWRGARRAGWSRYGGVNEYSSLDSQYVLLIEAGVFSDKLNGEAIGEH
jgi:hypothetical protein